MIAQDGFRPRGPSQALGTVPGCSSKCDRKGSKSKQYCKIRRPLVSPPCPGLEKGQSSPQAAAGGSAPEGLTRRGSKVNAGQGRKTCLPVAAFFRDFRHKHWGRKGCWMCLKPTGCFLCLGCGFRAASCTRAAPLLRCQPAAGMASPAPCPLGPEAAFPLGPEVAFPLAAVLVTQ